ncbi:hypothetical protein [Afifella aestuarii]|uniref:hypothetical protein n=1 Tax=Afifella aestuarii TaxID=1909496 RepID=UPI000FE354F3|nr:hypothetical protein [Afifella aestuarii]
MDDMDRLSWREMRPDQKARAVEAAIAEGAGSANEIAEALGVPSRNAIIGVCKRAKIDLPGVQGGLGRPRGRKPPAAPATAPAAPLPGPVSPRGKASDDVSGHMSDRAPHVSDGVPEPLGGIGVLFLERTPRQCAALLDAAPIEQRRCCGAPVEKEDGPHFCAAHRARFYERRSAAPAAERPAAGEEAA